MLTIENLDFRLLYNGFQVKVHFANGYGVSIINHDYAYCDENTYELAVLKNNKLYYKTPITNDVLGHQTKEQINEVMKEAQSYKPDQY